MAVILNIETSTKNCSISISKNGSSLILIEEFSQNFCHAENIHKFIYKALKKTSLQLSDIQAIGVSKGPGSYTGLRIGISTAKGFCYGLSIPLMAIDTLSGLIQGININNGLLIPLIYSKKEKVFTAVFDKKKNLISPIKAIKLNKLFFERYSNFSLHLIGDCVEIFTYKNYISTLIKQLPSARNMSTIFELFFQKKKFENLDTFEPFLL